MASFLQAWRALVRRRTFALLATLTLAVGISVSVASFSIVNGVLMGPLPFPDSDRLVSLYEASPARGQRASLIAPARLEDWQRLNRTLTAISGNYAENVTDTSGAEPERLAGRRVMLRFFDVFGMTPLAGRTFVADEELWRDRRRPRGWSGCRRRAIRLHLPRYRVVAGPRVCRSCAG